MSQKLKQYFEAHFKPPRMKSSTVSKKLQRLLVWSLPILSMAAIAACVESKKQKERDSAYESVTDVYAAKARSFAQLGDADSTLFYFERALKAGTARPEEIISEEAQQSLFIDADLKSKFQALLQEYGSDGAELAEVPEPSN